MASTQDRELSSSVHAEMINSTKGKAKINIDGFLYIKDKNHDCLHYWVCERKEQKKMRWTARPTTICIGDQHKIRKFDANQHNHALQASKSEVLKVSIQMKELAQISNDQPAQIINNVIATISREIQTCLLRKDALRQQIKRVKRVCDEEVEPKILNEFKLPGAYCTTVSGQSFGKGITEGNEGILVFTTPENFKWLRGAKYWLMNGTFKTVPELFRQLYSIHASAGRKW